MPFSYLFPRGIKWQRKSAAGFSPHRVGDAVKGDILFLEREYPPYTPKRKDEGPSPSTPHIGSFWLEELRRLRNVSAVYMASPWIFCDSLPVATARTPWRACDGNGTGLVFCGDIDFLSLLLGGDEKVFCAAKILLFDLLQCVSDRIE